MSGKIADLIARPAFLTISIIRVVLSVAGFLLIFYFKRKHGVTSVYQLNDAGVQFPTRQGIKTLWKILLFIKHAPRQGMIVVGHVIGMASSTIGTVYLTVEIGSKGVLSEVFPSDPLATRAAVAIKAVGTLIVMGLVIIQLLLVALGMFGMHRWLGRVIVQFYFLLSIATVAALASAGAATGVVVSLFLLVGLEMSVFFLYRYSQEVGLFTKKRVRGKKFLPTIPQEEVEKHKSVEKRLWVTYKGGVYDVTEWAAEHPGGPEHLLMAGGGPLEPYFERFKHHYDLRAQSILSGLKIGVLANYQDKDKDEEDGNLSSALWSEDTDKNKDLFKMKRKKKTPGDSSYYSSELDGIASDMDGLGTGGTSSTFALPWRNKRIKKTDFTPFKEQKGQNGQSNKKARPDKSDESSSSEDDKHEGIDMDAVPATQPKIPTRQIHPIVKLLMRLFTVWHVGHFLIAAAFIYFATHWMVATFPDGTMPAMCSNNGTLIDYHDISDDDDHYLQYSTCRDYAKYLLVSAVNWKQGVYLYCIFNGVLSLASLASMWLTYRRLVDLEPKDAKKVLRSLFLGFPKGTFFISYSWRDDPDHGYEVGELPRLIASFFPCAWLDIENLIPGTPVKETCSEAAKAAKFRFVFLSRSYLLSPNCLAEWEQIRDEPGKCFIFYYEDNIDMDFVKALKRKGHLTVPISEKTREKLMDADWMLTHLVRARRCNEMFRNHSPGINEHWRPTLRFWVGEPDWVSLKYSLPAIIGAVTVVCIDFITGAHYRFLYLFQGFEGTGILFVAALGLPLLQLFMGIYVWWYLKKTGYSATGLPDSSYLLIFFNLLGIVDPLPVFVNDESLLNSADFKAFAASGAIELVDSPKDADMKVLLLDTVDDADFDQRHLDETYVFWTKKGFVNLSDDTKGTFGHFLIGEGKPHLEFLCSKMLMLMFSLKSHNLTVGTRPFKTLFAKPKKGDEIARPDDGIDLRCCCCAREPTDQDDFAK